MKRILSCLPNLGRGKFLLPAVLGLFTLGTGPGSQACGPYVAPLHCPVAGPGKDYQPDGCPGGYCGRKVGGKGPGFDWKGGKIYFCCSGCPEVFKKSPEKFAANANLQLVASRQTKQVSCPLCGGALKNPVMTMIADAEVLLCSAECKKKLDQAKPAERLKMVFGEAAFAKAFTVKTKATAAPQGAPEAPRAPRAEAAPSGACGTPAEAGCCCCGKQK